MRASDIIREAFRAYRAWGLYLVGLTGAFCLAAGAACAVLIVAFGEAGHAWAALIATAAGVWAQAMVVDAVAALEEPAADRTFRGRIRAVVPYAGTLFVVSVLYTAGVGLGFLLVVPGILLFTWWAVVIPVVVLERRRPREAFARSKWLVTGRGRTVLWLLTLTSALGVLSLLPTWMVAHALPLSKDSADLVTQLAMQSVYLPFLMLCMTVLYADLRGRVAAPAFA